MYMLGPLDNLWLSCYHGKPLSSDHPRRQKLAIEVSEQTWIRLYQLFRSLLDVSTLDAFRKRYDNNNNINEEKEKLNNEEEEEEEDEDWKPWYLEVSSKGCDECQREEMIRRRQ